MLIPEIKKTLWYLIQLFPHLYHTFIFPVIAFSLLAIQLSDIDI